MAVVGRRPFGVSNAGLLTSHELQAQVTEHTEAILYVVHHTQRGRHETQVVSGADDLSTGAT